MGSFLIKKIKLIDVLFYALALYPLLKFNLSSIVLFALLTTIAFKSYKNSAIDISKKRIKGFLIFTLFFFLALISVIYSDDKEDGFKRITRLVPLLVVPSIILFFKPKLGIKQRTRVLNVFLFSNLIFVFILFCVYLISSDQTGISDFSFTQALSNRNEFQQVLDQYLGRDTLFAHKAYFSMGFVILATFSLLQAIKNFGTSKTFKFLYSISFFFFSFLIFSVFSFPNVVALMISILIVLGYNVKNQKISNKAIAIILTITICAIAGFYYKLNDIDVKRGLNFIESIFTDKAVELNDPRIEIYSNIKSIYKKATVEEVLFGFGIGDVDDVLKNETELRLSKNNSRNLLMFSEEFNDDYWHGNNIEIIKNKQTSPFNNKNADAIIEKPTPVISSFNISKTIELKTSETLTFSVYARRGSAEDLILRMGNIQNRASFNLKEGTLKVFNPQIKANINKVGEWYRCSITSQLSGEFLLVMGLSNNKSEYKYLGDNRDLYLWGAQLEKGGSLTAYENTNIELLKYVSDKRLNSHNNYLYFLLSAGILGAMSFILSIIALFYISFKNKNVYQITFCIIIAVNFLTENILSRHWGLVCVSLMLLVFFSNNSKTFEPEAKKSISKTPF